MEELKYYPFSKLVIPADESLVWTGSNPTFHRGSDWGILITDRALYYFSPFLGIFKKWKRFAIEDIAEAVFKDSVFFPKLIFKYKNKPIKLRTPYDGYKDEMDFDRNKLKEAVTVLNERTSV